VSRPSGSCSARTDGGARRAVDTFGEDDELLWVVRETDIGEVTADDVTFGGTTDKSYRFAQTYNVDPAAEEVEASEEEQVEAERERRGDA
jgi:ring-1,2-phenylacetyl-CoA epoxidase subunit PaaB